MISKHVLAISGKQDTEFNRNPVDVNVVMCVDIGYVTMFCSTAKIIEDKVTGISSWWRVGWNGPTLKRHGRIRH